MNIQYASTGSMGRIWFDAKSRSDEFLARAAATSQRVAGEWKKLTADEVVVALESGRELSTGPEHDSLIRCSEAAARITAERAAARQQVIMVRCDCGHSVPKNLVMSASLGTSCADCYDRLS